VKGNVDAPPVLAGRATAIPATSAADTDTDACALAVTVTGTGAMANVQAV
jgi:hypothetical protein